MGHILASLVLQVNGFEAVFGVDFSYVHRNMESNPNEYGATSVPQFNVWNSNMTQHTKTITKSRACMNPGEGNFFHQG